MTSTDKHIFIPQVEPTGGTSLGNSYLTTWVRCPRDWFNQYYRPTLDAEGQLWRGLAPRFTKPPFLTGRIFHDALAAWYTSGCRDGDDTGERSIDAALAEGERVWKAAQPEYEND